MTHWLLSESMTVKEQIIGRILVLTMREGKLDRRFAVFYTFGSNGMPCIIGYGALPHPVGVLNLMCSHQLLRFHGGGEYEIMPLLEQAVDHDFAIPDPRYLG